MQRQYYIEGIATYTNMKYSIIVPYIRRIRQIAQTFLSFEAHYKDRNDFEIVIVEDYKNILNEVEHKHLSSFINYQKQIFNIRYIESPVMENYNPSPLYNLGAMIAKGDYIILTSPEVLHKENILEGLDKEFNEGENRYVVCACECVGEPKVWLDEGKLCTSYYHDRWYQHSTHRNKQYHFCTAISKKNYLRLGGFDERYTGGISYDDDDFITTIRNDPRMILSNRDDLMTLHLSHLKESVKADRYRERLLMNKKVYEDKWKEELAL